MTQAPSPRTRVQRGVPKARYAEDEIKEILDAGWLCHISINSPLGVRCIPTIYARLDDEIFVHGSSKSGLLSQLVDQEACVVVSIVDGLVLARSAMHHSVNYRSVVLYGRARKVEQRAEKLAALDLIVNHLIPERSTACRSASESELKATSVYALGIQEASAKVRSGPPVDDAADLDLEHWAGVIPVRMQAGTPQAAPNLRDSIALPRPLQHYRLPQERD